EAALLEVRVADEFLRVTSRRRRYAQLLERKSCGLRLLPDRPIADCCIDLVMPFTPLLGRAQRLIGCEIRPIDHPTKLLERLWTIDAYREPAILFAAGIDAVRSKARVAISNAQRRRWIDLVLEQRGRRELQHDLDHADVDVLAFPRPPFVNERSEKRRTPI